MRISSRFDAASVVSLLVLGILVDPSARAQPRKPPIDEIIDRALKVAERVPKQMRCRIRFVEQSLDDGDRIAGEVASELEAIWDNGRVGGNVIREAKKGETGHWSGSDGFHGRWPTPLSSREFASLHHFSLLKEDVLWGHPVYVVEAKAVDEHRNNSYDGTIWIDAKTFAQLKGEFTFPRGQYGTAKLLQNRCTWLNIQEQHVWKDGFGSVPTYYKDEFGEQCGAGWSVTKSRSRSTIEWLSCG